MAKITNIIGSVVVASALWLGGTAYISSNTESYLNTYITKSNKLYQANGMHMSVEHFEEGFFSSTAKMKIDFKEQGIREIISKIFTLPIEIDYKIENGPLFFKDGLGLGTSRTSMVINFSDYLVDKEAFKKIIKDDIKLTFNTNIGFSNNATFSAKTNKITVNVEGDEAHISPLKIEGDMNIETFQGQMKMFVDSVVAENQTDSIKAKNIVLDADIKKFYDNGFYLGDFVFSVAYLDMKDELLPFELKGAKIAVDMNIDENKDKDIDMQFKFHADVGESKLPEAYSYLKKVSFNYALNGAKLEGLLAFQDFTKQLQAKQQAIMSRLQLPITGELDMKVLAELEKMQVETEEGMMVLLAGLVKKESTNFDVEMKMTDKEEKSSNLKMNIGYVGDEVLPTSAKALTEKFKKELFDLLSINFEIKLEKDYINNLPVEFQQSLSGQLQMGSMFGIVKETNSSFSLDMNYKPKTLMINGQDRTEMLQMLEMSLNQLSAK